MLSGGIRRGCDVNDLRNPRYDRLTLLADIWGVLSMDDKVPFLA